MSRPLSRHPALNPRRLLWIGPVLPWATLVLLLWAAGRPGASLTMPMIVSLAAVAWLALLGAAALSLPTRRWVHHLAWLALSHGVSGCLLAFLWFPGLEQIVAAEWGSALLCALALWVTLCAVYAVIGAVVATALRWLWPCKVPARGRRHRP